MGGLFTGCRLEKSRPAKSKRAAIAGQELADYPWRAKKSRGRKWDGHEWSQPGFMVEIISFYG